MRVLFASVWWSPTMTLKNAAVAGAVATTDMVLTSPAANTRSAESVSVSATPPAVQNLTPMKMLFSAAGQYTSAAAEARSPGRTGWPLVPDGEFADGCPAPFAVSSSECRLRTFQTGHL